MADDLNPNAQDITATPTGVLWATHLFMFFRQMSIAAASMGVLFGMLRKGAWGDVAAFFQGNQGIALATIMAGLFSILWGQIKGGKWKRQLTAFRNTLREVGIDDKAVDPTDPSVVPMEPITHQALVAQVVEAHPNSAAKALADAKAA